MNETYTATEKAARVLTSEQIAIELSHLAERREAEIEDLNRKIESLVSERDRLHKMGQTPLEQFASPKPTNAIERGGVRGF